MKKIKSHILWPGGNTTALIEEKFPRAKHVSIARQILDTDKTIEQVGFLENPENSAAAVRLQMMGGEFCGNATRTAAYYWSMKTGLNSFKIEVSGFPGLLNASVENDKVELELPGEFFQKINYEGTGPDKMAIIDLLGIRFVTQTSEKSLEQARKLIEKCSADFPAVGVLYVGNLTASPISIDPIVWVRETDTCYNETACGSGSIAAAIAAFSESFSAIDGKNRSFSGTSQKTSVNNQKTPSFSGPSQKTFSVLQPSGETFTIEIHGSVDKITKIKFGGTVKYMSENEINF